MRVIGDLFALIFYLRIYFTISAGNVELSACVCALVWFCSPNFYFYFWCFFSFQKLLKFQRFFFVLRCKACCSFVVATATLCRTELKVIYFFIVLRTYNATGLRVSADKLTMQRIEHTDKLADGSARWPVLANRRSVQERATCHNASACCGRNLWHCKATGSAARR